MGLRSMLLACALTLLPATAPVADEAPGPVVDPLDRVQLYRNANRGVPYLPLARSGASVGEARLTVRPLLTIELDGGPLQNVHGNLRPIDVDGNGSFEFLHHNGFALMQVWAADGRRLWKRTAPGERLHDFSAGTARDTVAVLDLDGDGKQDIAHCWVVDGRRSLVFRRGLDGTVIRSTVLGGGTDQECQLAAMRLGPARQPTVLVSQSITGPAWKSCKRNWVGYWAKVVAYDTQQRRLWERDTCDAGHYAWPVDEDQDGSAEAVYAGKYLLRHDGALQCQLSTWPGEDHVDGMAIADLDPARPGLEAVVVGRTGTAMFTASTCQEIWRIPTSLVRDPQHVALARLDPSSEQPTIVVDERGGVPQRRTFLIDASGRIVRATSNSFMPMQNANLDGALGTDEVVGSFGKVIDQAGQTRLDRSWYWSLKGGKVKETARGPYPLTYDRWQAFPLVFDYDRDGRDEIVTWGQSLIVVGKVVPASPWQPVLKLRSAVLGGAQSCDALPTLARRCDGRLTCAATVNGMLCPTPQPGTARTLQVQYTCGGSPKLSVFKQGTVAKLSCLAP
jgi:hypothetical protein